MNTMNGICSVGYGSSSSPLSLYGCYFGSVSSSSISGTNTCTITSSYGFLSAYCPNNK